MTIKQVLNLVKEYQKNDKKSNELYKIIDEQKIFYCPYCGRYISYFDLENWVCDFNSNLNNNIICSSCYEQEMEF